MALTEEDARGLEFDWLATDSQGFVGLFSTAGGGYTPPTFLEDTEAYDRAIEMILAQPVRTNASCERELHPKLTNTWRMMAERGVFAFDSDLFGGPYRRIATPDVPVRAEQLPAAVAEVARRIVYQGLVFGSSKDLAQVQLRF